MTTDLDAIPPARLRCMIRNIAAMVQTTRRFRKAPLRLVVQSAFGVGSNASRFLCLRADLSPDVTIPLKP